MEAQFWIEPPFFNFVMSDFLRQQAFE